MSTVKEIQKSLGVTPDGVAGPVTMGALRSARFDVMLDAGHTADHAREWPSLWPAAAWKSDAGTRICRALGMTPDTHDSVEHMLNVAICKAVKVHLEACSKHVLLFDDPAAGNNAELTQAWRLANGALPMCFVSVHCNASTGVQHYSTNTACGTVSLYAAGRDNGRVLARDITACMLEERHRSGGPNNRADDVATSSVAVLRNANASIATALVEVGFYDHEKDLLWMAEHLDDIGCAIARGILLYMTRA